jgi:hypothetical protein
MSIWSPEHTLRLGGTCCFMVVLTRENLLCTVKGRSRGKRADPRWLGPEAVHREPEIREHHLEGCVNGRSGQVKWQQSNEIWGSEGRGALDHGSLLACFSVLRSMASKSLEQTSTTLSWTLVALPSTSLASCTTNCQNNYLRTGYVNLKNKVQHNWHSNLNEATTASFHSIPIFYSESSSHSALYALR